jgi:hypothetical protein
LCGPISVETGERRRPVQDVIYKLILDNAYNIQYKMKTMSLLAGGTGS